MVWISRNFWPKYVTQNKTHFVSFFDYHHLHSSTSFPLFHTIAKTICIITCQSISIYFQPNARELQFPMKRHPCHLHGQLAFQSVKSPLNICINQKSYFKNECKASSLATQLEHFHAQLLTYIWFLLTGFSPSICLVYKYDAPQAKLCHFDINPWHVPLYQVNSLEEDIWSPQTMSNDFSVCDIRRLSLFIPPNWCPPITVCTHIGIYSFLSNIWSIM